MALLDKELLLQSNELERKTIELPVVGDFTIEVEEGLNGIEVFKRDKLVEQLHDRFKDQIILDGEKVDEWVVYQMCILAIHVKSPRMTVHDWAKVFYNKPSLYSACSKAVLEHTVKAGDIQSFLSTNYLEPELDKE